MPSRVLGAATVAVRVEDTAGNWGEIDWSLQVVLPTKQSLAETMDVLSGMNCFKNKGTKTALLAVNESIGASTSSGHTAAALQKIDGMLRFILNQAEIGNVVEPAGTVLRDAYQCLRNSLDESQ